MSGAQQSAVDGGVRALLDANPVVGEMRRGARRWWTGREEKILRQAYPAGGVPACLPLLAGRSASAIYNRANKIGLEAPRGVSGPARQSWRSSPAIDAVIRRTYERAPDKGAVQHLAATLGRPRWWVSKRARELGLVVPRFKPLPWTEAEEEIVREVAHLAPSALRKRLGRAGFARSEAAIVVHLKRLGADRSDPGATSANGLAVLMGVDRTTVTAWIAKGWLKAVRRGTARTAAQGGDEWRILFRDVRRFVIENAAAVDLRKVDRFWFIDMLGGGT